MDSYLLHGDRFNQNDIVYYIDPSLSYAAGVIDAIERWDALLSIDFVAGASRFGSDIYITQGGIDGSGGTLGVAEWFTDGAGSISRGTITFDRAEFYQPGDLELYKVALHEIGHLLGLDHPNDPNVLMNAFISPWLTDLAPGDIAGAQYLYGSEDGSVLPGGGVQTTGGWSYDYGFNWYNGWHSEWELGWTVGWNFGWYVGWSYGWTYGWNFGWSYGWNVGWHMGWSIEYSYSWQYVEANAAWELVGGWQWAYTQTYGWNVGWFTGWHVGWHIDQYPEWIFGWHVGWYFGWHLGWDYGWHQAWGWGWVYNSGAAQNLDNAVESTHSHSAGCACSHCFSEQDGNAGQEAVFEVTVFNGPDWDHSI